jgi:hypothetical protein
MRASRPRHARRPRVLPAAYLRPAAVAAAGLALGALLAAQLDRALGISVREEPVLEEPAPGPSPSADPLPGIRPVRAVVLPPDAGVNGPHAFAVEELRRVAALRGGETPALLAHDAATPAGRVVRLGPLDPRIDPQAFRLTSRGDAVVITAGTVLARLHGVAHLTEMLLRGAEDAELASLDLERAPVLSDRFVDLGGVGIEPDSAAWRARDYSHHNRAFQAMILAGPPFVDARALEEARHQLRAYVQRVAAYGYNGVVFNGFLEFVDFDAVGDGHRVYPPGSPYRARHRALRAAFGELFGEVEAAGMRVVLSTDMLALTEPLERHMARRGRPADVADPAFWEVYRTGLVELFAAFPQVSGVMVRIGETGGVFDLAGSGYYNRLGVTTIPAARAMLEALSGAAAEHGRDLYFRTWSVGVGETGGMHTRPDVYARLLDGLEAPRLVVSTKFTAGDFYSFLPLNPTLLGGEHPRLVELQARREYEGFGAFPNYLAPVHREALRRALAANPRVRGLWLWTQEGGPLRASPLSLYPFTGTWLLVDADVHAAGRLGWDPDADPAELAVSWVRRTFGTDPALVRALAATLLRSREPVLGALYVRPYARRQVRALGVEPPPMMWIFEWDLVSGATSSLSIVYRMSRDELDATIAEGHAAPGAVRRAREELEEVARGRPEVPQGYVAVLASLAYQEDLFGTLGAYREAILRHYHWLDTGSPAARDRSAAAAASLRERTAAHEARYGSDLDRRAWSFAEAERALRHAGRSESMAWAARLLLALVAVVLVAALRSGARENADPPSTAGLAAAACGTTVLGALVLSSFLSVGAAVLAAVAVAGTAGALLPGHRGRSGAPAALAASTGWMAAATVPLALVAVRGPGYLWLRFWTDDAVRAALVVAGTVAVFSGLAAAHGALRTGCGWSRGAAGGRLLTAVGAPVLLLGGLASALGLERALTALNRELLVLPEGLSVTLGITTHLGIPLAVPHYAALAGAALVAAGVLLERHSAPRLRAAPARRLDSGGGGVPARSGRGPVSGRRESGSGARAPRIAGGPSGRRTAGP